MTHIHPGGTSRRQQFNACGVQTLRGALCSALRPPSGRASTAQGRNPRNASQPKNVRELQRGPRTHTHTRRTRGCHADSNMWGTEVHSALRTLGQAAQCASTALSKTAIENGNETSKQHSMQRLCDACGVTRLPNMTTDMKYCLYVGLSCCCCGCDGCECCCLLVLLTSLITQNGKLAAQCARRGK